MIFYRLALDKILKYFHIDELRREEELRQFLLKRKKCEIKLYKLNIDQSLNLFASVLHSVISLFVCLTLPLVVLKEPCHIFSERNLNTALWICEGLHHHYAILEGVLLTMLGALATLTAVIVVKAVRSTNINISPWVERGKYFKTYFK